MPVYSNGRESGLRIHTVEVQIFSRALNKNKILMAHLGTKSADWPKYVTNNPNSANIKYVIENGIVNEPLYKDITLKQAILSLSQGQEVNIISKQFTQIGRSKYAHIRVNSKTGYIRISSIRKPTGRGGADAEQRTLDATVETLRKLQEISGIGRGNSLGVDLLVPGIGMFTGITSVEKVPNRIHGREAKSDFAFKNALGIKILFISHKDGTGPDAFGQYGGVSESSSGNIQDAAKIYNNPEVQSYLSRLYELYNDAVNLGGLIPKNPFNASGKLTKAVYKLVSSPELVNQSVYGPDYGGSYGPDNVHLIGQGNFIFNPLVNSDGDIYYRLSFSGPMELNGQTGPFLDNNSGYRATLITTYRDGRPTQTPSGTVPQTRTGIYPKRYRQSAISIDTLQ
jgi:hypothetical protein